jgi:hypothetical protein
LRPGLKNDLTRAGPRLSNHSEIRASGRGACNDDTQSDRLGRATKLVDSTLKSQ